MTFFRLTLVSVTVLLLGASAQAQLPIRQEAISMCTSAAPGYRLEFPTLVPDCQKACDKWSKVCKSLQLSTYRCAVKSAGQVAAIRRLSCKSDVDPKTCNKGLASELKVAKAEIKDLQPEFYRLCGSDRLIQCLTDCVEAP